GSVEFWAFAPTTAGGTAPCTAQGTKTIAATIADWNSKSPFFHSSTPFPAVDASGNASSGNSTNTTIAGTYLWTAVFHSSTPGVPDALSNCNATNEATLVVDANISLN